MVVLRGVHHQLVRPDGRHQRRDAGLVPGQHPGDAAEELRVRGIDARRLPARHGMTTDQVDTCGLRPLHHRRLGAGHIGHHLALHAGAEGGHRLAHGEDRDRDHHDVSDVDDAQVLRGRSDDPLFERLAHRVRVAVAADHRLAALGGVERHRERRAHEAETDDRDSWHFSSGAVRRAVWPSRRAGAEGPPSSCRRRRSPATARRPTGPGWALDGPRR